MKTPQFSFYHEHHLRQFDRLLTLGANARGTKAILGSIFYESNIPVNACDAWLQGIMAVLQLKGNENPHLLARSFFDRSLHMSHLWLGGIITGAQNDLIRSFSGLLGLNRIDVPAANWTNILFSFIQEPVSPVHHDTVSILQTNECRLMFLTQEPPREFPSMYPHLPLGDTNIRDTELGVQLHAHCLNKHCVQFLSVAWDCVGGRKDIQKKGSIYVVSRDHMIDNL